MKITRSFVANSSRYPFDSSLCAAAGWAQVDTRQDASYFGNWANPSTLQIFCYCEGDTILSEAASADEFVAELRVMDEYYRRMNDGKDYGIRIDPGVQPNADAPFIALGVADLLGYPYPVPHPITSGC